MPRSLRTKLTIHHQKIKKEIEELQEKIRSKEDELEELNEIIRTKGPMANRKYSRYRDYFECP